jgi:hypothetical protein
MAAEQRLDAGRRGSVVVFGGAILLGAFLLFQVQPLVSKAILPWFGGCPAVWTTCMLFFQMLLFGGYLYAHLLQRWLAGRHQAAVHLALIVVAALALPILPGPDWKPPDPSHPTGRILLLLAATVGMPYFVLSATSPLVQAWFSRTLPGRSPYRLYALSNFGSLAALLSYPFLFEPAFVLRQQSMIWSVGFIAYAVLCAAALPAVWSVYRWTKLAEPAAAKEGAKNHPRQRLRTPARPRPDPKAERTEGRRVSRPQLGARPHPDPLPEGEGSDVRPTWLDRVYWLGLPALASLMLLAATNHVCQDVAVVPLLWIVPLTLYLLSFIICFDHARWYIRPAWALAAVVGLIAALVNDYALDLDRGSGPIGQLAIYFAALFFICMVCHGEVARRKPAPRYLTQFYLYIALGGALGGVLVAIVAPQLFSGYLEWHIGLSVSLALCLGLLILRGMGRRARLARWVLGLTFGSLIACLLFDLAIWSFKLGLSIERARNFFGVVSVVPDRSDPFLIKMKNGRIDHGSQFLDPVKRHEPTAYYGRSSGVGQAIGYLQKAGPVRVGIVGLGVGTLAAYARPGDRFRFYEINPEVTRLAETYFTYLYDCRGGWDIVPGDARVSLERQRADGERQQFNLLVVDAFTGDAIPTHLLTCEALEVYEHHLASGGAIAFHISNKYLDLAPVLRQLAIHSRMQTVWIYDEPIGAEERLLCSPSQWMLLTRSGEFVRAVPSRPPPGANGSATVPLWTDHYSNLFQILHRP